VSLAPANPDRGEHELLLAGVPYRLRPSHTAMRAIERKTERSTLTLIQRGNAGALSLEELGTIAAELIRAGAAPDDFQTQNVDAERIGELIYEEGLHKALGRLTLVLLDAASGGRTASGEAKAVPAKTNEDAGAA
jgi:hypothetical protein